jgi:hypothetical protein
MTDSLALGITLRLQVKNLAASDGVFAWRDALPRVRGRPGGRPSMKISGFQTFP